MRAEALVLDKKRPDNVSGIGVGGGGGVSGVSGLCSMTFRLEGESFKTGVVLYDERNDKPFDDIQQSNRLWSLLDQVETKQQPTCGAGDGHIVAGYGLFGRRFLKKLPPYAMATNLAGLSIGHRCTKRRIDANEHQIMPLTKPIIGKTLVPLLLLVITCMNLQPLAGAQAPPPARSIAQTSASITEATIRDLLVPVSGQFTFIDPNCQWREGFDEIKLLLMILKCDFKPMMRSFESMMPYFGGPRQLRTVNDLFRMITLHEKRGVSIGPIEHSHRSIEIWQELLNLDSMIDYFYTEGTYILDRRDFCTYPTVYRLSNLKRYVLGSRLLSHAYDLITINYHSICLIKALSKLPRVPYLVKQVVDIYINGVDGPVPDLNQSAQEAGFATNEINENNGELKFNTELAIEKNGQLKDVVSLVLMFPFINSSNSTYNGVEIFKTTCKEFLIELDERWQSMEMMSKMLSTEGNGIERFNNYVMQTLIPTKHADVCSQLSAASSSL